jgi:hypothetical protein
MSLKNTSIKSLLIIIDQEAFYCMDAINCTDFIEYIVQKLKSSLREFCLKKGDWSRVVRTYDPTHRLPFGKRAMIEYVIKGFCTYAK